jgi:hypothetical protein
LVLFALKVQLPWVAGITDMHHKTQPTLFTVFLAHSLILFVCLFSFVGTGVWTQGLTLLLCTWAVFPALFTAFLERGTSYLCYSLNSHSRGPSNSSQSAHV